MMKPKNVESIYELTPMQQGLLFHVLSDPDSSAYFNQNSLQISGNLNILAMKQAWQKMIERHSILRTSFHWEGLKKIVQIVHKSVELPWEEKDWRSLLKVEKEKSLETFLETDKQRGFNFSKAPLIRLTLIYISENTYQLIFSKHHLLLDGWSRMLLYKEVFEFYNAFSEGKELQLKQPPQFENYVTWLQKQNLLKAKDFWQETLKGFTNPTSIKPYKNLSENQNKNYQQEHIYLSEKETEKIKSFAKAHQLTVNTIFLGAWSLILHYYSREFDVVFGVGSSGRPVSLPGVETIIGLFINTLPMRVKIESDSQLIPWLKTIQERQVQMYEYEYSPLWEIQRWSDIKKGTSLFETLVLFQNYPVDVSLQKSPDNLQITNSFSFDQTHYPLSLTGSLGKEMGLEIIYDPRRFDGETIQRLLNHLKTLIVEITTNTQQKISQISMLTQVEYHQLLVEWNNTTVDYPKDKCIHQLFEEQVEKTPDRVAVVFKDEQLTYQQLNAKANQLAHYLQSLGVKPETLVGICIERSVEMVIGLLGILKAGGAYVPIDPSYPQERLNYMLADSALEVLVTQKSLLQFFPEYTKPVVCLDADLAIVDQNLTENLDVKVLYNNLAYVIYTSGSTGKPKGVEICHLGLVNFLNSMSHVPGLTQEDIFYAVTTISFDIAALELYLPLIVGAKVIVASRESASNPDMLLSELVESQTTVMQATPATWRMLLTGGWRSNYPLKVLCGGEALSTQLATQILETGSELWNMYGPTEATIWSIIYQVEPKKTLLGTSTGVVAIGHPISNTQTYILDSNLQPVPIGVPGELHIGGIGLARGYLNRSNLTTEKFISNPFENNNSKLYKTGDLACYLPDGNIEYIGRIDNQVKIRGFRIELGEIEATLNQHPALQSTVVVAQEYQPKDKRLVAYMVCKKDQPTTDELRIFLKKQLPEYMVPSTFVFVEAFPLTPNGKIDRKSFPTATSPQIETSFKLPRTPIEELITDIWQNILGLPQVGVNDNFFELGGHSLLATQVVSRLRQTFSVDLPLRTLFEFPTIEELSGKVELLAKQTTTKESKIVPIARNENLPLSFAQQRLWFLDQLNPGDAAYNISGALRLIGKLNISALENSLNEIVRRHEILRTTFAMAEGQPIQVVAPHLTLDTTIINLDEFPENQREVKIPELVLQQAKQPFDLTQNPLLRIALLQVSDTEHIFVLIMHHIISDGWSLGVLIREIATLYNAYSCGESSPLPELEIQYGDFAYWQTQLLQGDVLENLLSYWRQQLAGAPSTLDLPIKKESVGASLQESGVSSRQSKIVSFTVAPTIASKLQTVSRAEGVTLFMTLLAALQTLLYRYTNSEDIVVGTDIANRNRAETESLIGFFVNLLVLRTNLSGNPTFKELLKRVREVTLGAYAHQDLPFAKLVDALRRDKKASETSLFQVLFVFQNALMPSLEFANLTITPIDIDTEGAKFDLAIFVEETEAGIVWRLRYSTDIFEHQFIMQMSENLQTLLTNIADNPNTKIKELEMLTESEKKAQLAAKTKRTKANFKKFKSIKPKAVSLPEKDLIKTTYLQPEKTLPLVIEPNSEQVDIADWAMNNREFFETNLRQHGAILLKGFKINSISEFEKVAGAISPGLFGEYGDLPREGVSKKVYGSTPYPEDKAILFHNESSHLNRWPQKIFFLCLKVAESGGETPIVDCRNVYKMLSPKLREKLEEKQLMYVRNYVEDLDVSWQDFFHTNNKSEVESYCKNAKIEFEWLENNGFKTFKVRPAITTHPKTKEKIFFNQIQLHHISYLDPAVRDSLLSEFGEKRLPRNVYYGDGSPIEDSVIEEIGEVYEKAAINFPWQAGNMIMLDNMLIAHGRNPYVGERKIVVAMGELMEEVVNSQ